MNEYGEIVREEWSRSGKIRYEILLDAFVVMPNHEHGIVVIVDGGLFVGAHGHAPGAGTTGWSAKPGNEPWRM